MFIYTTGDLLKSKAEALVNTVNCEGYMGKGIAYQFKLEYPDNNKSYVKACETGALRVGKIHYYNEKGKIIINFPTKDKWRAKSKIEYIELGLKELILLINKLNIKTIAIPPLGSGNGGLIWSEVKQLIEKNLSIMSNKVDIIIYEPSKNYISLPLEEPKLSTSGLILMDIKGKVKKFDTLRLQKTAYFINIFSGQNYFKFGRHKYGPYDNAIAIISKNIKEYQKYHNVKNTGEAYEILYKKIVSEKVENKLKELKPFIKKSTEFVNSISSNHELECLATVTYVIEEKNNLNEDEIVIEFKNWSEDKAKRYSEVEIIKAINKLYELGIIEKTLTGYIISK